MKPISEMAKILVDAGVWRQEQVESLRAKVNEAIQVLNRVVSRTDSLAVRVLAGEVKNAPVTPQGMTTYTFAGVGAEEVPHGLGRVPAGYLVIRRYPIGQVADASLADWNARTAWLQTDTPGLTITVLWF